MADQPRSIVHIDMDAFFAAVEQRDDPSLRGKPVVIGADPKGGKGRGVVSTCSYEARPFGIHSAQPISQAYRACPHAVFLRPSMGKYGAVSKRIMTILYDFTPLIEPVSIDEAFLDITTSAHLFGGPVETCKKIKERIRKEEGLTASVGLAPIMMAAKIASDLEKPDGLVVVNPGEVAAFLAPLPIERLWGVGKKTAATLRKLGIKTIGDILRWKPDALASHLGNAAHQLHDLARGVDDREIETDYEAQSIGNETTFEIDTNERPVVMGTFLALAEKVSYRLRREGWCAQTITIKVRFKDFTTKTRALTIAEATNYADTLYETARTLFDTLLPPAKRMPFIRLIGLKASKLQRPAENKTLFSETVNSKQERLHKTLDRIIERYGEDTVHRGRREGQ